jgi:hypothetical protein
MDKLTAEEIEKIIGDAIDSSAPRDVIIREATKAIIQSLAEITDAVSKERERIIQILVEDSCPKSKSFACFRGGEYNCTKCWEQALNQ